jgi:RHS repeat-associated protein
LLTYGLLRYAYRPNGELLTRLDGSNSETTGYVYDALGNLNSVTLPDGAQIDYIIDGKNHRLGKKLNGVLVTAYLYNSGGKPIAELNGAGEVISRFVYGSRSHVPDYMQRDGKTFRIVPDIIGSPRIVINVATGVVEQMLEYDEFGNIRVDTNPGFQPFGFAGGLYDQQTKLTRLGARDYDAQTGRFTSKDPKGISGGNTNLYAYVKNDPVNYVDISGLAGELAEAIEVINALLQFQKWVDLLGGENVKTTKEIIESFIDELEQAAKKNVNCALATQKMLDIMGADNGVRTLDDIFYEFFSECRGCAGEALMDCVRKERKKKGGGDERKDCPELFPNL